MNTIEPSEKCLRRDGVPAQGARPAIERTPYKQRTFTPIVWQAGRCRRGLARVAVALLGAVALVLLSIGIARADTLRNDLDATPDNAYESVTMFAGTSIQVSFSL